MDSNGYYSSQQSNGYAASTTTNSGVTAQPTNSYYSSQSAQPASNSYYSSQTVAPSTTYNTGVHPSTGGYYSSRNSFFYNQPQRVYYPERDPDCCNSCNIM